MRAELGHELLIRDGNLSLDSFASQKVWAPARLT